MATWLTPTWLFIFVNLTILTLYLTSHFGSQRKPQQQEHQLARPPSLIDRVRSFNLGLYRFEQPNTAPVTEFLQPDHANLDHPPTQLVRSPSLLDRLKGFNLPSLYRSDSSVPETELEPENETPGPFVDADSGPGQGQVVRRSKSDRGVAAPERQPEKIKKSASEKSALDESDVVRRRENASLGDDEEVDARADDFINRFKQQLRLQRLDSLLRYRELLKRN
jgi:hypothetical protein